MLLFLTTALLLGMRHALDPDHVVAVSTLVAEERRLWPAARLGLIWGLGHLLSLAVVGLPALWLRLGLPAGLEETVDFGVALLLVLLGLRTLLRLYRQRVHLHFHDHGGHVHVHFHAHVHGHRHNHHYLHPGSTRDKLVTFVVGMVHGLAGSGAATVLAMTQTSSIAKGIGYLFAFGVGTCLGMFAMTFGVAAPALVTAARFSALHGAARAVAGLASITMGGFMMWEIAPKLFNLFR